MPDSENNSILAMFADDARPKCFGRINDFNDCMSLRNDLDELYRCSNYKKRYKALINVMK